MNAQEYKEKYRKKIFKQYPTDGDIAYFEYKTIIIHGKKEEVLVPVYKKKEKK